MQVQLHKVTRVFSARRTATYYYYSTLQFFTRPPLPLDSEKLSDKGHASPVPHSAPGHRSYGRSLITIYSVSPSSNSNNAL